MAVLLIASESPVGSDPAATPLGASLTAAATQVAWTRDGADHDVLATVLIDDHTELRPGSLDLIAATLASHPEVDVFTADALVGGELQLRGAWSPTRIAHRPDEVDLVVVRGHHPVAGLERRLETLFAADPTRIGHLPAVLVERPAAVEVDPSIGTAADELLDRRRTLPAIDAVSVVIPTGGFRNEGGTPYVDAAIAAVRRGGVADIEILLVVGDEFVGDPEAAVSADVRLVHRPPGSWNFSAAVNLGLLAARHDHVLVLNDDIEAIDDGWLLAMAHHLRDPEVGVVGSLLQFPDLTVQHAGMVIDDAVPLHCFAGQRADDLRSASLPLSREVAAVTGACLLARRADLLAVGGLNEALPFNFNDVDVCFKILRTGKRVVISGDTGLIHHEGASREPITHGWEWDRFVGRWGEIVDPWYHPAFVRPDDPDDRRRNADHLVPGTIPTPGELRTATIRSIVHRARLQGHGGAEAPE